MTCIKFVIVLVFITSTGLAANLNLKGANLAYKEPTNVEVETGIGPVHSRLRSVFKTTKNKRKRRRKLKADEPQYRMLAQPAFIEDTNIYWPDSSENRWKKLQRVKSDDNKIMPKIYITKLPEENEVREPEIFFSKQLKENETAVEAINKVKNAKETIGANSRVALKDNTLHTDDVVINEDILEPAIRSDHFYQDGLENVNDMIYNSQVINQPSNSVKSFNGEKHIPEYSTEYPYLEYVSSTAMIVNDPGDDHSDSDSDKYEDKEIKGLKKN